MTRWEEYDWKEVSGGEYCRWTVWNIFPVLFSVLLSLVVNSKIHLDMVV